MGLLHEETTDGTRSCSRLARRTSARSACEPSSSARGMPSPARGENERVYETSSGSEALMRLTASASGPRSLSITAWTISGLAAK
jgi:hypothetical protein